MLFRAFYLLKGGAERQQLACFNPEGGLTSNAQIRYYRFSSILLK